MANKQHKPAWNWWYLLLLIQFVGALWVPLYNSIEPSWAGIPFFYWFQLLMVFIGAGLTAYDLPLIIAFVILVAFTYSGGLRAPAAIAIVKDLVLTVRAGFPFDASSGRRFAHLRLIR